MKNFEKLSRIKYAATLIAVIIITGITGFIIIECFSFIDAVYMTIITVTTVGFGEVHKLSDNGKIFTIFLIVSSFGTFAYAISIITRSVIEGEFKRHIQDYKIKSGLKKMKNHVIVCGYGRNGQQAVAELVASNCPMVIIDHNHAIIEKNQNDSLIFIEGDATENEVLLKAGVKNARALITTFPADADNLFVVLTARSLNPGLTIVSRATNDSSCKKLRSSGVNNVVMPEKVGGSHMVSLVLKPDIIEFIERLSVQGDSPTNLEEIICSNLPETYKNKTISELEIRAKSGANIVGFKTPQGEFIVNPNPDTKIISDAKIFVLGTPHQISRMKEILEN